MKTFQLFLRGKQINVVLLIVFLTYSISYTRYTILAPLTFYTHNINNIKTSDTLLINLFYFLQVDPMIATFMP